MTVSASNGKIVLTSSQSLKVAYEELDRTKLSLFFTVDVVDPTYSNGAYDANDQRTFNRLSAFDMANVSSPFDALVPVIGAEGKVRLHVHAGSDAISGFAEQALGLASGTLGLPSVDFDLKLDASAKIDFSKPAGERAGKGIDDLTFDNITIDAGTLINLVLKPVANVIGTSIGPVLAIVGDGLGDGQGFLNQPIPLMDQIGPEMGFGRPSLLDLSGNKDPAQRVYHRRPRHRRFRLEPLDFPGELRRQADLDRRVDL